MRINAEARRLTESRHQTRDTAVAADDDDVEQKIPT